LIFVLAKDDDIVDTSTLTLSKNEVELAIHGLLKKESVNTSSCLEKLRF
jgi:hypothetical protein